MVRVIVRAVVAFALVSGLLAAFAVAADPEQVHSFQVTLTSRMDMNVQGKMHKMTGDTDLNYTWKQRGKERTLSFDSMRIKVTQDGKETMNAIMNRARLTHMKDGKMEEVSFAKAPEALKTILQDSFEVPICRIQVDKNGQEIKRAVVAGPGAKSLVDNGMIVNALLFHPPFPRDKDTWSAPAEMSMGNGGFAKGELTYRKIAGGKGGQAVKVSGTLANKVYKWPGSPLAFKNAKYVVTGEQTYDLVHHEWISGKLDIDASVELTVNDKPAANYKGTMIVTLKVLPGKK